MTRSKTSLVFAAALAAALIPAPGIAEDPIPPEANSPRVLRLAVPPAIPRPAITVSDSIRPLGEGGGQRVRVATASPLMKEVERIFAERDVALAALLARSGASRDLGSRLALQQEAEGVKRDAEIAVMRAQLATMRSRGRADEAALLERSVNALVTERKARLERAQQARPVQRERGAAK